MNFNNQRYIFKIKNTCSNVNSQTITEHYNGIFLENMNEKQTREIQLI